MAASVFKNGFKLRPLPEDFSDVLWKLLTEKLLVIDKNKRMTIQQFCQHEFVTEVMDCYMEELKIHEKWEKKQRKREKQQAGDNAMSMIQSTMELHMANNEASPDNSRNDNNNNNDDTEEVIVIDSELSELANQNLERQRVSVRTHETKLNQLVQDGETILNAIRTGDLATVNAIVAEIDNDRLIELMALESARCGQTEMVKAMLKERRKDPFAMG